jgi:hypothetical protein
MVSVLRSLITDPAPLEPRFVQYTFSVSTAIPMGVACPVASSTAAFAAGPHDWPELPPDPVVVVLPVVPAAPDAPEVLDELEPVVVATPHASSQVVGQQPPRHV